MKKDYTKFSESSNNKNEELKETFVVTQEDDSNVHVRPVVNGEIQDTPVETIVTQEELQAEVTEEIVGAVANAIVDEAKETNKTIKTVVNEIVDETKDNKSIQNDEPEIEDDEKIVMHLEEATVSCKNKLNVRKEPSKNSEVLCVINKDTQVAVDIVNSTDDFYKVIIDHNNKLVEGYCMKQFITVKQE